MSYCVLGYLDPKVYGSGKWQGTIKPGKALWEEYMGGCGYHDSFSSEDFRDSERLKDPALKHWAQNTMKREGIVWKQGRMS